MSDHPSVVSALNTFVTEARPASVADLRRLFAEDQELLFRLCADGIAGTESSPSALGLQTLARTLAVLLRDGFQVVTRAGRHVAEGSFGGFLVLEEPVADRKFLEDLYSGSSQIKSLSGHAVSKKQVDFYLTDFPWEDEVRGMDFLRLDPLDEPWVGSRETPPYQVYELLDCAREVVRAPLAAWRGLRQSSNLKDGVAYCGLPSRSWRNNGQHDPPRAGYVYLVYADGAGKVFDWDWVPAASDDPNLPVDHKARFAERLAKPPMAELVCEPLNPTRPFSQKPVYSRSGDCLFYYFDESEAFAQRVDHYLTAYFSFASRKSVGFKLKYVSKLMNVLKQWSSNNADEGILVTFEPDVVRVKLHFLMRAWISQQLPTSVDLKPAMELFDLMEQMAKIEVSLPKELVG